MTKVINKNLVKYQKKDTFSNMVRSTFYHKGIRFSFIFDEADCDALFYCLSDISISPVCQILDHSVDINHTFTKEFLDDVKIAIAESNMG